MQGHLFLNSSWLEDTTLGLFFGGLMVDFWSANEMFFFYCRIWKSSKNQEDRRLPFLNISSSSRVITV